MCKYKQSSDHGCNQEVEDLLLKLKEHLEQTDNERIYERLKEIYISALNSDESNAWDGLYRAEMAYEVFHIMETYELLEKFLQQNKEIIQ